MLRSLLLLITLLSYSAAADAQIIDRPLMPESRTERDDVAQGAVWLATMATVVPSSIVAPLDIPSGIKGSALAGAYVFGPVAGYAYADLLPQAWLGVGVRTVAAGGTWWALDRLMERHEDRQAEGLGGGIADIMLVTLEAVTICLPAFAIFILDLHRLDTLARDGGWLWERGGVRVATWQVAPTVTREGLGVSLRWSFLSR